MQMQYFVCDLEIMESPVVCKVPEYARGKYQRKFLLLMTLMIPYKIHC